MFIQINMKQDAAYTKRPLIKLLIFLLIIILTAVIFYFYKTQYFSAESRESKDSKDFSAIEQVELPFRDKTYSFSYKNVDPQKIINISTFSTHDHWKGSGFYDVNFFFEYPESLTLAGSDRSLIVAEKEIRLGLGSVTSFDLIINLQTDPDELETANLIFVDENKKIAKYNLPNIHKEWNYIEISKEKFIIADKYNWNKITRVRLEFIPRPLGKVVVSLAGLRGEVEQIYTNDWNATDKQMLILDNRNNIISLMARNMRTYPMVTALREITNGNNYSFQVVFSPLTETWSGLFFRGDIQTRYGYYFLVNGLGGNKWEINKLNKDGMKSLANDTVPDLQFKSGEWYYLKVEVRGKTIKAYLSKDGKEFITLGGITDSEFTSGGVGLTVGAQAVSLFNDFIFTQY